ncbi:ribonuclease III [Amniculicola lignicola CBS 123094]|uniref:Ribonuclease III n=1 Tax=Amniculicola lignicola CBS 123094 TaxID=1392246 RepID=A0A6A5X5G9_9PLEO|nr:ribonuclease III [Amniculicola lignicola CBS 123094]
MALTMAYYHDMTTALDLCEHILEYTFTDKSLGLEALHMGSSLVQALSYKGKIYRVTKNDRLETMGDKVLDYVLAKEWYPTGLSKALYDNLRQKKASNTSLFRAGQKLGLNACVLVNAGCSVSERMMADAVEAIIGAVQIDGGWDAAEKVIQRLGLLDHPILTGPQVGIV